MHVPLAGAARADDELLLVFRKSGASHPFQDPANVEAGKKVRVMDRALGHLLDHTEKRRRLELALSGQKSARIHSVEKVDLRKVTQRWLDVNALVEGDAVLERRRKHINRCESWRLPRPQGVSWNRPFRFLFLRCVFAK